ncbi:dnaJ homolog subfamily C member 17-like [Convolutriloba macropyga]|uniref:dnaJ homolog subfamily C member 17-like n=1 Tax=Convolutriloba macropyga TaxID=536237 RepID=UPI003F521DC0
MPTNDLNVADLFKEDLYAELEIESNAEEKEIRKAYRKKALKCHPDKNPDNPAAADMFRKISAIFEVLVNKETRAEYDRILKAKQAAAARNYELDAKRRKLKEDLERKEKAAAEQKDKQEEVKIVKNLENLLRDLRANGSKLLHEEQELLKKEMNAAVSEDSVSKLKIKWNKDGDPNYDSDHLTQLLSKYGEISALVVSSKKKGTAILEFSNNESAIKAFNNEKGVISNRLYFEWLGVPPANYKKPTIFASSTTSSLFASVNHSKPREVVNTYANVDCNFDLEEKEEEVFAALRRAAEKQKLNEQLKFADD